MAEALYALFAHIEEIARQKGRAVVAIDGPCASGKTTLAAALEASLEATVLHMDDFFLQPHQRTPERYAQPGGNVDRERFEAEVLCPLSRGEAFVYRRFDCASMALLPGRLVQPGRVVVIEGSYSLHPQLVPYYDLRILLRVDPDTQSARILAREGKEKHAQFVSRWIPLENRYFAQTDIESRCDVIMTMEGEA